MWIFKKAKAFSCSLVSAAKFDSIILIINSDMILVFSNGILCTVMNRNADVMNFCL